MNIFKENQKIHRKNIEEHENRAIEFWSKKIDENWEGLEDLNMLYMLHGSQSARVFRILLRHTIEKWKKFYNENTHM